MTTALTHVSEKPWSDYNRSDYSVSQWHQACLIHQHSGEPTSKSQCKLPVKTPDGAVNRNGVHAAAAALAGARGGVQASPGQMATAKASLKHFYSDLGEDLPDSLMHYGTKGMKWGVRHDPGHQGERAKTKKIAKLDKKYEQRVNSMHTFLAIHNRAAQLSNDHDIDRINNKPEYKGKDFTDDSPLRRKYYAEHQRAFVANVRKAAAEMGTNASGTKEIEIGTTKDGDWQWRLADVKHADEPDVLDLLDGSTIQVFYDAKGHITRVEPPEDLEQSAIGMSDEEFFAHYGVKGMHWGRSSRRNTATASREPTHEDFARATSLHTRAKSHGTKVLSNKEMRDVIARMELEQKYSNLSVGEGKAGSNKFRKEGGKFVGAVLKNVGQQVASELLKGHVMSAAVKAGMAADKKK